VTASAARRTTPAPDGTNVGSRGGRFHPVQQHGCEFPQHLLGNDAFANQSAANQTARDGNASAGLWHPTHRPECSYRGKTRPKNQTRLSALVEFAPAPGAGRCVHAEALKRTLQISQITGIPVGGLVSLRQLSEIVSDKTGQRGIPFGCKTANFSNDFVLEGESYVHFHMLRGSLITCQGPFVCPSLQICEDGDSCINSHCSG